MRSPVAKPQIPKSIHVTLSRPVAGIPSSLVPSFDDPLTTVIPVRQPAYSFPVSAVIASASPLFVIPAANLLLPTATQGTFALFTGNSQVAIKSTSFAYKKDNSPMNQHKEPASRPERSAVEGPRISLRSCPPFASHSAEQHSLGCPSIAAFGDGWDVARPHSLVPSDCKTLVPETHSTATPAPAPFTITAAAELAPAGKLEPYAFSHRYRRHTPLHPQLHQNPQGVRARRSLPPRPRPPQCLGSRRHPGLPPHRPDRPHLPPPGGHGSPLAGHHHPRQRHPQSQRRHHPPRRRPGQGRHRGLQLRLPDLAIRPDHPPLGPRRSRAR